MTQPERPYWSHVGRRFLLGMGVLGVSVFVFCVLAILYLWLAGHPAGPFNS